MKWKVGNYVRVRQGVKSKFYSEGELGVIENTTDGIRVHFPDQKDFWGVGADEIEPAYKVGDVIRADDDLDSVFINAGSTGTVTRIDDDGDLWASFTPSKTSLITCCISPANVTLVHRAASEHAQPPSSKPMYVPKSEQS